MHRKILGPGATGGPAPRSGQPCRVAEQLSDRTRPVITGIGIEEDIWWLQWAINDNDVCYILHLASFVLAHLSKAHLPNMSSSVINDWKNEFYPSRHSCCCSGFVYFSEMSSHCQIASHLWLAGFENSQPVLLQWRAFRADGLANFEVPFRVDSASVFARRLFIWNFIHQAFNSSVHAPNVFNERTLSGVFHVLFSLNIGFNGLLIMWEQIGRSNECPGRISGSHSTQVHEVQ